MKDLFNREIRENDLVLYSTRTSTQALLNLYKVLHVTEDYIVARNLIKSNTKRNSYLRQSQRICIITDEAKCDYIRSTRLFCSETESSIDHQWTNNRPLED